MVLKEQELVRDSLLQCEKLRETARLEKDTMVLKAQEQALIANRLIDLLRVRLLEQEQEVGRLETAKKQQGDESHAFDRFNSRWSSPSVRTGSTNLDRFNSRWSSPSVNAGPHTIATSISFLDDSNMATTSSSTTSAGSDPLNDPNTATTSSTMVSASSDPLNDPIKKKANVVQRRAKEVADLLVEINAKVIDISSAAQKLCEDGDKQWLKVGRSGICCLCLFSRYGADTNSKVRMAKCVNIVSSF